MKKFFNILIGCATIFLVAYSCEAEQPFNEGQALLHFDNPDQTAPDGNYNVTYGVTTPVSSDQTTTLVFNQAKSSAILGSDFTIVEGNDVIKAGAVKGDFVINVTKAGALAKKQAVFTIKSSTIPNAVFNQELTVRFSCSSTLGGTYQYSTVNYFTPDTGVVGTVPVTGNVTFTPSATVAGEYLISDASFGAYNTLYAGNPAAATNVRLRDQCNTLSFFGANQFSDTHSISNIVVNGNKLTFRWTTSYGEYGTTTLTKSNGNWPALN